MINDYIVEDELPYHTELLLRGGKYITEGCCRTTVRKGDEGKYVFVHNNHWSIFNRKLGKIVKVVGVRYGDEDEFKPAVAVEFVELNDSKCQVLLSASDLLLCLPHVASPDRKSLSY